MSCHRCAADSSCSRRRGGQSRRKSKNGSEQVSESEPRELHNARLAHQNVVARGAHGHGGELLRHAGVIGPQHLRPAVVGQVEAPHLAKQRSLAVAHLWIVAAERVHAVVADADDAVAAAGVGLLRVLLLVVTVVGLGKGEFGEEERLQHVRVVGVDGHVIGHTRSYPTLCSWIAARAEIRDD